MGSLISSLGPGIADIGALTGDNGKYSLQQFTKNKPIQAGLGNLISSYNSTVSQDSSDLNSYIKDFMAQTPQVGKWTGQEIGAIDPFYNGGMDATLGSLRADRMTAGNEAVANAIANQRGNMNRSMIDGGGVGDSSYMNRQGMQIATNTDLANELANIDQERADQQYVTGNQVALGGRRAALSDALTNRAIAPANARQMMQSNNTNDLMGLVNILNGNNQYATKYTPSESQLIGNVVTDVGNSVQAMGSSGGGGGGPGDGTGVSPAQSGAVMNEFNGNGAAGMSSSPSAGGGGGM